MTASSNRRFHHANLTAWNLVFHYAQAAFLIVYGVVLTPLYLRSVPETTFGVWLATGQSQYLTHESASFVTAEVLAVDGGA